MKILFRRRQTAGRFRRVGFLIWCKLELDEEEIALIKRYDFDKSVLIYSDQENLLRNALIAGVIVLVVAFFLVSAPFGRSVGIPVAIGLWLFSTWFYFDWFRETVLVKDLMHGRNFRSTSIVEFARREDWLKQICAYLRQVMESAKHWDGDEIVPVAPLDPEMAKQVMIRGLRWAGI